MSNIGSNVTGEITSTPEIRTDKLTIGEVSATGIATSYDSKDPKALVTMSAIGNLINKVDDLNNKLDPQSTFYQDLAVMSTSLIDKYFKESEWTLSSASINSGVLYLGTTRSNDAFINTTAYLKKGMYLLQFQVLSLPDGYIQISYGDTVLKSVEQPGIYQIGFEVTDTDTAIHFKLVNATEQAILGYAALYFIADKFYNYVLNLVKENSTLDTSNYVTVTRFNEEIENFSTQFETITNRYLDNLRAHEEANNPHRITTEMMGAAPVNHSHSEYTTRAEVATTVNDAIATCAPLNHTHPNYVTTEAMNQAIADVVNQQVESLVTAAPNIVTKAPTGNLPSRFMGTDIDPPVQILLPSVPLLPEAHNYNQTLGVVTTNVESLVGSVASVFTYGDGLNLYGWDYTTEGSIIFKLQLHSSRKLKGYSINADEGQLYRWEIYSSDTTFVHAIDNTDNDWMNREVLFDSPIETDTFIVVVTSGTDVGNLSIVPLLEENVVDSIHITKSKFSFTLPSDGVSKGISLPSVETERLLEVDPATIVDMTDYFVFAHRGEDKEVVFEGSYFPPEYGNERRGEDVLNNQYSNIEASSAETYIHPAYGTLRLREGATAADNKLTNIYSKGDATWYTADGITHAVIEQTFASSDILLTGYTLSWRNNDEKNKIPDQWTLTVVGRDIEDNPVTVVYDSTKSFYPFYSAQDDDIVYHKKFDIAIKVDRVILTLDKSEGDGICLNKLSLYVSERFYSVPENCMYKGLTESQEICLGWVYHQEELGFIPYNVSVGKSEVIPLNNLEICTPGVEYQIPNPYLTTDVQVTVSGYRWLSSDSTDGSAPQIVSITPRYITILPLSPAAYAVSVMRAW